MSVTETEKTEPFVKYEVDFAHEGGACVDVHPGRVYIGIAPDDGTAITPAEARSLGRALLAAADEAERSTS